MNYDSFLHREVENHMNTTWSEEISLEELKEASFSDLEGVEIEYDPKEFPYIEEAFLVKASYMNVELDDNWLDYFTDKFGEELSIMAEEQCRMKRG